MAAVTQLVSARIDAAEALGGEIAVLCSRIYAAQAKLFELIAQFEEADYATTLGFPSTAHWLNYQCGIGMNAAREKVRVANALVDLPKLRDAFAAGRLSYSKVRALTRIADRSTEEYLLMFATHGTAHHVEQLVAKTGRARRLNDPETSEQQHRERYLSVTRDDDGSVVLKGRFPAEQGELITKALEFWMDREASEEKVSSSVENPPAETSRRLACDAAVLPIKVDGSGQPLSVGRKTRSIPPSIRRALWHRDGGCRFPGCTHTRYVDGHHIVHWSDGGETSLDNLVLLCRRHHRLVHEGGFDCVKRQDGKILFRDPKDRSMPASVPLPRLDDELDGWLDRQFFDLEIDADTPKAQHDAGAGDVDWDLAVSPLLPP